jgi:hypothetical protein
MITLRVCLLWIFLAIAVPRLSTTIAQIFFSDIVSYSALAAHFVIFMFLLQRNNAALYDGIEALQKEIAALKNIHKNLYEEPPNPTIQKADNIIRKILDIIFEIPSMIFLGLVLLGSWLGVHGVRAGIKVLQKTAGQK